MQNASDSLLLFCTPTWPSDHVSAKQEYGQNFNFCRFPPVLLFSNVRCVPFIYISGN